MFFKGNSVQHSRYDIKAAGTALSGEIANVSSAGKQFACWYKQDKPAPWKADLIPIEGGQPTKSFDIPPVSPLRWTPDGNAITCIKTQNGISNIWSQPLNSEQPKQLTDFTSEQIYFFYWSNGNNLIC